ncbi:hypothetical protein [Pseudoduganella sp. UC29_71]|uniref:hypothetical protein n=1 Tax=Pseudoduganella sp. UC29_71 TaxID=3350174 RepID=UPI003672E9DD
MWPFKKNNKVTTTHTNVIENSPRSNPLHEYLNRLGFPWQLPRSQLEANFGAKKHPAYSWNVIEIVSREAFVDNLIWPISVQDFPEFSPKMPAALFSGISYSSKDARQNLQLVVKQLQPILGLGMATSVSNCVGHRWDFTSGSVELHAWPPELQKWPATNPAHALEPRLKTGCHISIDTGFRQSVSPEERVRIETFSPIARIAEHHFASRNSHIARTPQRELEFIRLAESDFEKLHGWIGCSPDRSTLIFFTNELYVVPIADIKQFQVGRVLPAKGGGGSWLQVECRCEYADQVTKVLTICSAIEADELNEFGAIIANSVGKKLILLPYEYDC